jgi:hypothetical protein
MQDTRHYVWPLSLLVRRKLDETKEYSLAGKRTYQFLEKLNRWSDADWRELRKYIRIGLAEDSTEPALATHFATQIAEEHDELTVFYLAIFGPEESYGLECHVRRGKYGHVRGITFAHDLRPERVPSPNALVIVLPRIGFETRYCYKPEGASETFVEHRSRARALFNMQSVKAPWFALITGPIALAFWEADAPTRDLMNNVMKELFRSESGEVLAKHAHGKNFFLASGLESAVEMAATQEHYDALYDKRLLHFPDAACPASDVKVVACLSMDCHRARLDFDGKHLDLPQSDGLVKQLLTQITTTGDFLLACRCAQRKRRLPVLALQSSSRTFWLEQPRFTPKLSNWAMDLHSTDDEADESAS